MLLVMASSGAFDPIGSFEVLAKLASGGMGVVYLARRRGVGGFQRLIAVKELHGHLASDPAFVDMFMAEARLAARIHHPNVVSIAEIGQSNGNYFVVMDYIEGANLAHLHFHALRKIGALPRNVAVRIVLDALAGLHAAHEMEADDGRPLGLVHRDVSPQNIMVGVDGLSRLTDFGIARAASDGERRTLTGEIKGKLAYMAPEQLESEPLDRTSDVFAMGIVLWESLAGRRLFASGGDLETVRRILREPIPSLRAIDASLTPALDAACLRALERPRGRRYASAAAFAEALEWAARLDTGIATQREVAACLDASLGESLRRVKETTRRISSSAPSAKLPNLTLDVRGDPKTEQLPLSEAWGPARKPLDERDVDPTLVATSASPMSAVPLEGSAFSSLERDTTQVLVVPTLAAAPASAVWQATPATIAASPRRAAEADPARAPSVARARARRGALVALLAAAVAIVAVAAGLLRASRWVRASGRPGETSIAASDASPATATATASNADVPGDAKSPASVGSVASARPEPSPPVARPRLSLPGSASAGSASAETARRRNDEFGGRW